MQQTLEDLILFHLFIDIETIASFHCLPLSDFSVCVHSLADLTNIQVISYHCVDDKS